MAARRVKITAPVGASGRVNLLARRHPPRADAGFD
jgi:hypothetical protein